MAFDKKLLPEGAITLQEFMEKHDPKEIENYKVSYLLLSGKPLEVEGVVLEGVEVKFRPFIDTVSLAKPIGPNALLAQRLFDWRPTAGWNEQVSYESAQDSVIAVLDYHKPEHEHGGVGKPAEEWLKIEGFDPKWLEGAQFEGRRGCFTPDPRNPNIREPYGWNLDPSPTANSWIEDVFLPWRRGTPLCLAKENEAKALALLDGEWRERREESLGASEAEGGEQDNLTGWSNLTEAIKSGKPIDWEKLDGMTAKCAHPQVGALTQALERDEPHDTDGADGWWKERAGAWAWGSTLYTAWHGKGDWTLFIKGEIPLKARMADELTPGTFFHARATKPHPVHYTCAQLVRVNDEARVACYDSRFDRIIATLSPDMVEVVEEYGVGTFSRRDDSGKLDA